MTHDHLKTMGKITLNQDRTTTKIVNINKKRKSCSYTFEQHIRLNFQDQSSVFPLILHSSS